jgi:membrane fusion protein (multidrug efflux system)
MLSRDTPAQAAEHAESKPPAEPPESEAPPERRRDRLPAVPAREETEDAARQRKPTLMARLRARPWLVAIGILVLLALLAGAVLWWLHARRFESTDDAFIDARNVPVSAQVAGAVIDVPVTDNQKVEAGDVLARIDPRDFQAALDQAKAQVTQAQASIENLDAQIAAQQARITQAEQEVSQAQGALQFARQENARYQQLVQRGAGTEQRAQQAASDLTQRQAAYDAAEANRAAAEKQIAVLKTQKEVGAGQLAQARAAQELAETNLARTTIRAPVAGRVAKIAAAKGLYAQPGQSLMMFVPSEVWITANFKETQLALMRPGQPVTIEIDAYPDRTFTGRVDSIQSGSGTAFSLLPVENATGNYVKIVQRVPVKIVFDQPPDVLLGPGMSVVPTVQVR